MFGQEYSTSYKNVYEKTVANRRIAMPWYPLWCSSLKCTDSDHKKYILEAEMLYSLTRFVLLTVHKGVLQGAEKIMTSWHKEEEEASRRRATKRDFRGLEPPTHL